MFIDGKRRVTIRFSKDMLEDMIRIMQELHLNIGATIGLETIAVCGGYFMLIDATQKDLVLLTNMVYTRIEHVRSTTRVRRGKAVEIDFNI